MVIIYMQPSSGAAQESSAQAAGGAMQPTWYLSADLQALAMQVIG